MIATIGTRTAGTASAPARSSPASPAQAGPGPADPLRRAIGPLLLLAVWTAGSATGLLDQRVLSAPWTVVSTAGELIAERPAPGQPR